MGRRGVAWGLAALLTLLLSAGLVSQVYRLQLNQGNTYAPYSTYRSDPSGLRVWHNALAAQPGLRVLRNERDPVRLDDGTDRTLIYAGVHRGPDDRTLIEATERFAASGGNLVLAYWPIIRQEVWDSELDEGERPEAEETDGEPDADSETWVDTEERWGYAVEFTPLRGDEERPALAWAEGSPGHAHPNLEIPWYSGCHLAGLDPAWHVEYTRDGLPVVARRTWGKGSITVLTDCYPLTNEALRHHRAPDFLAWLVGDATEIIFDEYHLGVQRDPNLMALLRRHRLHYFLVALATVALLFVWRSAAPLVPRPDADTVERQRAPARRRAQQEALPALLRRAVPARDLMPACARAWGDAHRMARATDPRHVEALRRTLEDLGPGTPRPLELLRAYNLLASQLRKGPDR